MNNDLINYKYEGIRTRKRMSISDRAAQFASFSCLVGYEDKIKESSRYVDYKKNILEDERDILDGKMKYIKDNIKNNINVSIRYFVRDKFKDGGVYKDTCGIVKKIDEVNNLLILDSKFSIYIGDILDIDIQDKRMKF